MKKFWQLMLVVMFAFVLVGCGGGGDTSGTDEPDDHEHVFVDGKCECGEVDPNASVECEHDYFEGVCTKCGTKDPNYKDPEDGEDELPEFGAYVPTGQF